MNVLNISVTCFSIMRSAGGRRVLLLSLEF
jgi:hypothetical protein